MIKLAIALLLSMSLACPDAEAGVHYALYKGYQVIHETVKTVVYLAVIPPQLLLDVSQHVNDSLGKRAVREIFWDYAKRGHLLIIKHVGTESGNAETK